MQGHRSNVEPLTETFDFDHAPGSSTSTVDQQIYWNDVIHPPPTLPSYLISQDESSVGYEGDAGRRETVNLNSWHAGASSSRDHITSIENSCDETKLEGIAQNRRDSRRLDRITINLNQTHDGDDDQELMLGPRSSGGGSRAVSQNGMCAHENSHMAHSEPVCSTSSARCLSGKRKSMEGDTGQSSGSFQPTESSNFLPDVSARHVSSSTLSLSSSENVAVCDIREGNPNPRTATEPESSESSYRSFRMRINPNPGLQDDELSPDWPPLLNSSSGGQPSIWSPPQPSLFDPVSESMEARLATPSTNSHGQQLPAQGFPRLVLPLARNGFPGVRTGGSSNSPSILRNSSNTPSELPNIGPSSELRAVGYLPAQLPLDWSITNGNNLSTVSGNPPLQVGSASSRLHYQNLPAGYRRVLTEFARRTLPVPNSESMNPQRSFQPNSGDTAPLPGVGLRATHQHPLLRSALLMDRRAAVMGAPLAVRTLTSSREGRSRMISEHIRNALDLMRRGENLRFEDVLILDHSAFYGLADLHDRHRDLRLDVDNMSYEELLALEERIGNVNTGLSEETIRKLMKHRMHLSAMKLPDDTIAEPCCICQENYLGGEEIGTLDCGHEFHTACIKQWLILKNICPICKLTALGP
ncbi:putative E3 ubiquitin-protein ligase HIP1 [Wolffia australiana]